jgi:hypothetical protein
MTQRKSTFSEEFAIIPKFMYWFCAAGFVVMFCVFLYIVPHHDPHSPPFPVRVLLSVLTGTVLSIYFLLVGYVNQDAKRRDMGQVLWTLLVIFIPNAIGFLVYFLLRKPLIQYCPKCGDRVEKDFHFCAKCGCELSPACGSCGRAVGHEYSVCPYCGKALGAGAANPAAL